MAWKLKYRCSQCVLVYIGSENGLKKILSPSHSVLKVPVNRGSRAFPVGAKGSRRFTSLSQRLHRTTPTRCESGVKAMWKQIPDTDRPKRLCTGCLRPIGERWKVFLKTSRARSTHAHVHYICARDRLLPPRISWSQSQDSCSRWRVSCIRNKFSREFCAY